MREELEQFDAEWTREGQRAMSDCGRSQNNIANIRHPEQLAVRQGCEGAARASQAGHTSAQPTEPAPPPNTKQAIAAGLQKADAAAQAFNSAARRPRPLPAR